MSNVLVEIMFPWNGSEHRTKDILLSRVPCVGEYIEIDEGSSAMYVDTVIHVPQGRGPRLISAQVRVK